MTQPRVLLGGVCPLCRAAVPDVPSHFGSDDCPALVAAFGPVTEAGKRAEAQRGQFGGPAHKLPIIGGVMMCRCGNPVEVMSRRMCRKCSAARVRADRIRRKIDTEVSQRKLQQKES